MAPSDTDTLFSDTSLRSQRTELSAHKTCHFAHSEHRTRHAIAQFWRKLVVSEKEADFNA